MKGGVFVILALALMIAACAPKVSVCNKPYIMVGSDCCLDKNGNSICDKDDVAVPEAPAAETPGEASTEPLSEQPNKAKFDEYLGNVYLGKLALGMQVGGPGPNSPVKTAMFNKATDQFCTNMDIKKAIPANSIGSATYDVASKTDIIPKSTFPMELKQGGSSGCQGVDVPPGKYEYKMYIDNVLVAVLPFEVQ